MAGSIIQVPNDLDNKEVLKRFLQELITRLNEIFGFSGKIKFMTEQNMEERFSGFKILIRRYNDIAFKNEHNEFDNPISYTGDINVLEGELPQLWQVKKLDSEVKQWTSDNFVSKTNIDYLTQTISDPPTQEEVQNIQDKVNEILQYFNNP